MNVEKLMFYINYQFDKYYYSHFQKNKIKSV